MVLPETPLASSARAAAIMRATRGRDTRPELAVRRAVHRRGLRYRVDVRPEPSLRRRADLVFTRAKVAVFVDGCFWHRCPQHGSSPKANGAWWAAKLAGNEARDRETDAWLLERGWVVVRVWEHESPESAADKVELAVRGEAQHH